MCFHASRFEARMDDKGEMIRYDLQDTSLWNAELIERGKEYLNKSSKGTQITKYHVEATIAYWHTIKEDSAEKWDNILNLYNRLLIIEYSPMAALNRTYAVSKVRGVNEAIIEAEKLQLGNSHLYHILLGHLYKNVDIGKAKHHLNIALKLAKTTAEKSQINKQLAGLKG